MAQAKDTSMHWVVGIILLITGVIIIAALVVTYSQGQTNSNVGNLEANVNISPAAPVITSYAMWKDNGSGSESTLAEGATATGVVGGAINVILNVNVTDGNGYNADPINVSARVIRTINGGTNVNTRSGATNPFKYNDNVDTTSLPQDSERTCDLVANFNIGAAVNAGGTWRCPIQLFYLSDPTAASTSVNSALSFPDERWNWLVEASDNTNVTSNYALTYFEYDNILGLTVTPDNIDLGTHTVGVMNPATATPVNVENKGNQQLDVALEVNQSSDADAWTCVYLNGVDEQPNYPLVSDIHYDINSTAYAGFINESLYNGMTPLNLDISGSGLNQVNFDLDRGELTTVSSFKKDVFSFATGQPISGGRCTLSAMVFTAKKAY